MVLYICLFQNIMFAFMPEDDFGIKLKASKKLKKIEMFFLTLCLLFIIRLRFQLESQSPKLINIL